METSIQAVLLYSLASGAILIYLPFMVVGWARLPKITGLKSLPLGK